MVMVSHFFWVDIWARLGPAETYGVVGFALYCLAYVKIREKEKYNVPTLWWGILTCAIIIAIGSKENFLILLPFSAIIVFNAWKQRRLNKRVIFLNIIIFSFGFFIASAVIIALIKTGTDIYQHIVLPANRFQMLKSGVFSLSQWTAQLPFWLSLLLWGIANISKRAYPYSKLSTATLMEIKRLLWIETALIIVWYSQYFFYNGVWPTEYRYDFPGILARDLAYIVLICWPAHVLLQESATRLNFPSALQFSRAVAFLSLLIPIVYFGLIKQELKSVNYIAKVNSEKTQKFTKTLLKIVEEVKENPNAPIVFDVHNFNDYEPVISLQRFMSAYGVKNPIALAIARETEKAHGPLEINLVKQLQKVSDNGSLDGLVFKGFYPIKDLKEDGNCFVLSFSGDTKRDCKILERIW